MATITPNSPLAGCVGANVSVTPTTQQPAGVAAVDSNQFVKFAISANAGTITPANVNSGQNAQYTVPSGAAIITAIEDQWQRLGTHGSFIGVNTAAPRTGDARITMALNGALVAPVTTSGHHLKFGKFDVQFNGVNAIANYDGAFQSVIATGYAAGDVFAIQIVGTIVTVLRNNTVIYTFTQAAVLADNERAGFSLSSGTASGADHDAFLPNVSVSGAWGTLATVTLNVTGVVASITPATTQTVPVGGSFNFVGAPAGLGTWSIVNNGSGGTVDNNGLYVAGSGTGTDVLRYTVNGTCQAQVSVNVVPAFNFAPADKLPTDFFGSPVNVAFSGNVSGGTAPYTYALASGTLPPGLTLNTSTGALTGTATGAGTYTFSIRTTDANGLSVTKQTCIVIEPALVLFPPSPVVASGQSIALSSNAPGGVWSSADCGGSVTASGSFIAPANLTTANKTCTLTYTSPAGQIGSLLVTIEPALAILPVTPIVMSEGLQQFSTNIANPTWSVSAGTITSAGLYYAPLVTQRLEVTITATSPSGQKATTTFTVYPALAAEPAGLTVSKNGAGYINIVGGSGNYEVTQPLCGTLEPTALKGQYLFHGTTVTSAGSCSVRVKDSLTGQSIVVALAVTAPIVLTPAPNLGETCVRVRAGEVVAVAVNGGSGQINWSWSGEGKLVHDSANGASCSFNSANQSPCETTPALSALYYTTHVAGSVELSVVDVLTGESATLNLCVEAPMTCVVSEPCAPPAEPEPCCETRVDCGDAVWLSVPGFIVNTPTRTNAIPALRGVIGAKLGDHSEITGVAAKSGAYGDSFAKGEDGDVTFFVTPSMLQGENLVAVGWSNQEADITAQTIGYAAVITKAGLAVWNHGKSVASRKGLRVGDEIKIAVRADEVTVYHQGVAVHTFDAPACSGYTLDLALEGCVTLGGAASATWTILTPGTPDMVGTISGNGRYIAGQRGGTVMAMAYVGNGALYHVINVAERTPVSLDPNDVWKGGLNSLWVNVQKLRKGEKPKLAKDGSPSRDLSPNAIGLLGDYTVDGVNFNFTRTQNDIKIEGGTIDMDETDVKLEITLKVAQTRNANLLAIFNPNAKVSRVAGGVQVVVGRQKCASKRFNLLLVKESGGCDGAYDTFYVPNARVTSGVTHNFKVGELISHEVVITAYPDLGCDRALYIQTLEQSCTEEGCA